MIVSGSLFYGLSIGARLFALDSAALTWIRERIGDGLIHGAPDVAALCELVAADKAPVPAPGERPAAVDGEFGDARIKAVLREVLFA
jgi:hypothetical protein